MSFYRVITHDTTFHADDVFAVALLKIIKDDFTLVRTRDPELLIEGQCDPATVVLDVGGKYHPLMLNFDHHQDTNLMSAAGLVYGHFKDQICPEEAQPFFEKFIEAIDLIDTNRGNIYATWSTLPTGFRNVSSIIGGFNRDVNDHYEQFGQFLEAVDFAGVIIKNEIYQSLKKASFEAEYARRTILPNNVAIFGQYSGTWKEKTDHVFAVMPHANGWQIQSRDTSIDVVPERVEQCPGFIFRHKSGFMAVVKEEQVAIAFALSLKTI